MASGDEEKFAIISQAIQKDEKIFRLNDKILEHDKVGCGEAIMGANSVARVGWG